MTYFELAAYIEEGCFVELNRLVIDAVLSLRILVSFSLIIDKNGHLLLKGEELILHIFIQCLHVDQCFFELV